MVRWLGTGSPTVTGMSLRLRLRAALPEAIRSRDKAAVSALRGTLAALDNAEAVPLDEDSPRAGALEASPAGAGATEAARRELGEREVLDVVRAEADERLEAAARLTAPAHAARAERLRAEAQVLLRFLDTDEEPQPTAKHG
ncbi:hypothetical protein SUDANB2_05899 [Streptomyces sp. enrichment culture]